MEENKKKIKDHAADFLKNAKDTVFNVAGKTKDKVSEVSQSISKKLDANGDGKVDLKDFILLGTSVPGVNIKRQEFLEHTFSKRVEEARIIKALETTPKIAGIDNGTIEYCADEVVASERKVVSAASAVLGVPGAAAIPVTLAADISQYFAFLLRAAQKLMYLYGYPEIEFDDKNSIDEGTLNALSIAIGVMFGIQGADTALRGMSKSIVESIKAGIKFSVSANPAKLLGGTIGAGLGKLGMSFVGLTLPIIGGAISGGLTYATFTSGCDRLRKELRNSPLNTTEGLETN